MGGCYTSIFITHGISSGLRYLPLALRAEVCEVSVEPDGDDQDVGREEEPPVDHLVVGRLGQTLKVSKYEARFAAK